MALVLNPGQGNKDSVVVEESNVDGLFQFSTFHIIKQSEAQFLYTGPKIPKDEWYQMLAFFKWTYETHHSESQARLYVNREANTWKIWVYPQESKTGMSARELDNEEMHRQQALLGPEWMAFGTVHHHCSGSAFQSGTDERNEENQDGLHITIGNMDKPQYDLHARFYRKGRKFLEFPLSWFWDITDEINEVPEWMWDMLKGENKSGIGSKIAKDQMTLPAGPDVTFPEQWKQNVIDITPPPTNIPGFSGFPYMNGGNGKGKRRRSLQGISHSYSHINDALFKRTDAAWEDIMDEAFMRKIPSTNIEICLDILNEEETIESIMAFACYRHKVDPQDLRKYKVGMDVLNEHDDDLQRAGVKVEATQDQRAEAPLKLPDPKTTTTTKGQTTTKEVMGMTDSEWADYQTEQYQRGSFD